MRRNPPDLQLLAVTAGLVVFGLVALASATGPTGFTKFGDSYYFFKRQLLFGVLPGAFLLFLAMRTPVERIKKFAPSMIIIAAVQLCLGFIPGLRADFGSGSWIQLFGFSLQPSEIAKLCLVLYFAWWLARRDEATIRGFWSGFVPFAISVALVIALMMAQSDLGTTSVIIAF